MERKKSLKIIFFTVFLNLMGFAIILPLYPTMLHYYLPAQAQEISLVGQFIRVSETLAGSIGHGDSLFMTSVVFGCLLGSMYAFLQFIFAPIWGKLSDRFGRRQILTITLTGTAISSLLWCVSAKFELFILARVLAGVMAGNLSVASAAAADVTSKNERTKAMGLVGAAFGLGFLLGPAIGGIASKFDLSTIFPAIAKWGIHPFSSAAAIAAILGCINLVWVLFQFKETLPVEKRYTSKLKEPLAESRLGELVQTPAIRKTNLTYFIFILAFSGLEFTLSFLATERFFYTATQVGYLFLFIGSILILTQGFIIRRLTPILGEKKVAFIGIVAGIISFNVIAFANDQIIFFLGSGLLALSVGLASPSLTSLVSLYATEDTQGRYLGFFRAAGSLARALGPLAAATLYFCWGSKMTYLLVAFVLLWPLSMIFILPKPLKEEPVK